MSKLLKLKKQGSTLGKVNQDVNLLASEVQSTTHQFNIDNQNSVAKLSDYLIKSCPFFGHIKTSTSIAASMPVMLCYVMYFAYVQKLQT